MDALRELSEWLTTNGAATRSMRLAHRLLAIAREKHWERDPGPLVAWLEELALDVARAWMTDDPEEPRASSSVGTAVATALSELLDSPGATAVTTEDLRVASAVLGLAGANQWTEYPQRMANWLHRLASEVAEPTCEAERT